MFRTVAIKAVDRLLRKSGLYRVLLSARNTRTGHISRPLKISEQEQFFVHYSENLENNSYNIFGITRKEMIDPAAGIPFWKVSWKGFDPKDFWEIARGWQWLPAVIQAKRERKERIATDKIITWLDQNPYPNGLAWAVALDVAIRAINLLLIYSATEDRRLVPYLHQHYVYLKRMLWLSKGAIRNNHYLGELTALALLAKVFESGKSKKLCKLLEKEIARQFYSDGVNVEQSVRYHKFSLEFVIIANLFLDVETPILDKAGRFLMALRKPDGSWPSIGDDDLGCVIRLHDDALEKDYLSVLSTVAAIMQDGQMKFAAGELAPESELFIPSVRNTWEGLRAVEPDKSFVFPEGGFYTYRTGWSRKDSWFLIKFGPHKWHAHADLFHIELTIAGQPILIDSGTFRYNNVAEDRRYFRSTAAHNTLEFNEMDQSKQLSTFRWLHPARVVEWNIDESDKDILFTGIHNGYKRYGVLHIRQVTLDRTMKKMKVIDILKGSGKGSAKVYWHLDPEIQPRIPNNKEYVLTSNGVDRTRIIVKASEPMKTEIVETPFSKMYGHKSSKKTIVICSSKQRKKDLVIETRFSFE